MHILFYRQIIIIPLLNGRTIMATVSEEYGGAAKADLQTHIVYTHVSKNAELEKRLDKAVYKSKQHATEILSLFLPKQTST